jgi:regulator of nucleoside diphosphate kinase
MIFAHTYKEAVGYSNRYAVARYNMGGGGNPPRNGLAQNQLFAGQILSGGRFHVLKPDRMCCLSEFLDFQLVSKPWRELSEPEGSLLMAVFSHKKLALESLASEMPETSWHEIASGLDKAGYLRRTDESQVVELTLVGEAEIQHRLFNLEANGGIRIQHHSLQDHEIDLAQASTLSVNVDGMLIRIITLPNSGAIVRVDHDAAHHVYMCRTDKDKNFTQAYIDRITPITNRLTINQEEEAMKNNSIRITSLDVQRLRKLLDNPDLKQQKPYLQELQREIDQAVIVESNKIAANTITMNSTVQLVDLDTDERMIVTLVYPENANMQEGKISVLAPVGTAILGCSEGETIQWEVPDGIRSLKIDRILYQPEAAGDFAL